MPMSIRTAWLIGAFWLTVSLAFAQNHRLGNEAEGAKHGHSQQLALPELAQAEVPMQAHAAFAPDDFRAEGDLPAPPQPLNFWGDILPVCAVIAAIWLTFLILGLTLSNSIAAGIFLLLMAWTALLGVGALLLVILALVQLSSRSERVARRAHDPMWRMKRWRSRQ